MFISVFFFFFSQTLQHFVLITWISFPLLGLPELCLANSIAEPQNNRCQGERLCSQQRDKESNKFITENNSKLIPFSVM